MGEVAIGQHLILADKGGRGGGIWTPLFLAESMCKQPLMNITNNLTVFVIQMKLYISVEVSKTVTSKEKLASCYLFCTALPIYYNLCHAKFS